MQVDALIGKLERVTKCGTGWMARCPAHDDRRASLSVGAGDDGRVLVHCHAGCKADEVVAALGVEMRDLFADARRKEQPEAIYDYFDEQGALLYQVLRFAGKQFRQRRPDGNGWMWRLGDVRRVLYRLPDILASADDERAVYVCEGEKDADALARLGLVATCNPGGAGRWRQEYNDSLRGREVVVLPDNDDVGRAHAAQVAKALQGIALRVRVVHLPDLPPKGDVSDWLAAGGTRAELERIVSLAPDWGEHVAAEPVATERDAEWFVPSALRVEGLLDEVRRRAATSRPFHVTFLDDSVVGVLETDLVVLGAPTGAGKTTLAAIFAQQAAIAGARVHYFALEAHANEIEQRILFRVMARLAWERLVADPHELRTLTYRRWVHGRCDRIAALVERDAQREVMQQLRTLRTFYRSGRFTRDDLVRMISASRGEADLIVLDHLHFLDGEYDDEVRAMQRTVKAVSDAIQDARTPVIAIAHLRKRDLKSKRIIPDIAEFHGSSDITKIATMVITMAPAIEAERRVPWVAPTYMHVAKDRLDGERNYVGMLEFDVRSNSYRRTYRLGRLVDGGARWEAIPFPDLPWWAEHEALRQGDAA